MPKIRIDKILKAAAGKPMPYFEDYLSENAPELRPVGETAAVGCASAFLLFAALQWLLQELMAWGWALLLNVTVGLPVAAALAAWAASKYRRPKLPKDKRQADISRAASEMRQLASRKRLAKALGPALAPLMEEAARHWSRTMAALNGPLWTGESLPGHWRAVREKAIAAANDAMGDLVLIASSHLKPVSSKTYWQEIVGEMVSIAVGAPSPEGREPIPAGFEAARMIADKLSLLANEVERTAVRAVKEQREDTPLPSASSLDSALEEFRSVHEAERELRQNVGDSGL